MLDLPFSLLDRPRQTNDRHRTEETELLDICDLASSTNVMSDVQKRPVQLRGCDCEIWLVGRSLTSYMLPEHVIEVPWFDFVSNPDVSIDFLEAIENSTCILDDGEFTAVTCDRKMFHLLMN